MEKGRQTKARCKRNGEAINSRNRQAGALGIKQVELALSGDRSASGLDLRIARAGSGEPTPPTSTSAP